MEESHQPIFDQLTEIKSALKEVQSTLAEVVTERRLSDRVADEIRTKVESVVIRVDSIYSALYGKEGGLGLIAKIEEHEKQLNRLSKVIWMVVGFSITAVGAFIFDNLIRH